MKKVSKIVALLFFVCSIMSIFSACSSNKYKLTVEDPNGFIIEKLHKKYAAGTTVTVKTGIIFDASLTIYLDGVALDDKELIEIDGRSHWEHYFVMPDHDAVLSFNISDGFPPGEQSGRVELSAAEVNAITAAYIENNIEQRNLSEEKISLRCFGAFDGAYAFFLDVEGSGQYTAEIKEIIAGVEFIYTKRITVYSEGSFCFLKEAYENDILSKYDVLNIHKNYTENTMVALNETIEKEIKTAYASTYWYPDLTEEDIGLRCFGSFNGVYVLFVDVAGTGYHDTICRETISGIEFIYSNSHSLTVYSDGEFYSITDAFEKGIISHDELLTAQKNYRVGHEYLYH